MERIRTMADLEKLQKQQQKSQQTRDQELPRIIVGMGTCGIAAGARDVLLALMEEIDTRNLNIRVSQTGCIGMCEHEPLVDVQTSENERITYGKVTVELARKIITDHVVNGRIVREAAIARLTKED